MTAPLVTFPAEGGGKYHGCRDNFTPVALCDSRTLLVLHAPMGAETIHVAPKQERVHPIVCKRCLAIWGGLK